ncbi:MAG: hypothetical protein Q9226_009456 [Calogaya cf. arnoldii]
MPPFATRFGASLLACGFPGCNTKFYFPDDIDKGVEAAAEGIRTRRAKHFADVFGIPGMFQSQTGLPDPTLAPKAPSSYHNTLHISIARVWSRLSLEKKQAILRAAQEAEKNVGAVEEFIVDKRAIIYRCTEEAEKNVGVIEEFVVDVRIELCAGSHRGNIYSATIDEEVRALLPSFWQALRVASKKAGLEDRSGAAFVLNWMDNKVDRKMVYELSLR